MPQSLGSSAFGQQAANYNDVRPDYPNWMFDLLVGQNALYPGVCTLEIGAGNGLATREIVARGAAPLTLIEPDTRFETYLTELRDARDEPCKLIFATFELSKVSDTLFDLVVIATTFHWLDPVTRIRKLAECTQVGGHVALIWNVFQGLHSPDPFHEATHDLLSGLPVSPSGGPDAIPVALDTQARKSEFLESGFFEMVMYAESHWSLSLSPGEIRSLYSTYSNLSSLPEDAQSELLDKLEAVARNEFGGVVVRNMTSPMYLFRRC